MYLSDKSIHGLLSKLKFTTDNPKMPFIAADQIQPCSIDLRLDNIFWVQKAGGVIDLRRSKLLELSPRRHWDKVRLRAGECVTLKPGELLLGRTYEAFTIPSKYAGKLEGRSSFARLGLSVHCSADFINPGYRGHMPLELINFSKKNIRVFPYIPICQVMIIKLSSKPDRIYGERELSSKYMDDDGGPSYWWRDKRIKQLHSALMENDVSEKMQNELLDTLGSCDPDLIERFEGFVRKLPHDELTNTHRLLEIFSKGEDKKYFFEKLKKAIMIGIFPLFISASIGSLFSSDYSIYHYLLWALTALSIPISFKGFFISVSKTNYLTNDTKNSIIFEKD